MAIRKTTGLMAAVLAATTLLATGLTVLPSSVQNAQANPCSDIGQNNNAPGDFNEQELENEIDCDFENIGSLVIIEGGLLGAPSPLILPTP
jgi:hypothetical protein